MKSVTNEVPANLKEDQQATIEFVQCYRTARTSPEKSAVLRGLRAVQLKVVLGTPEAQSILSQPKLVAAINEVLRTSGVRFVTDGDAPYLVLSVDTLDLGRGLAFQLQLDFIEQVVLPRKGEFLKTLVKSRDNAQFGGAATGVARDYLTTSISKVMKKFTDGVSTGN